MKKILIFILLLLVSSVVIYSIPNNLPTPGTTSATLNSDGSLSIGSGSPGQIMMKSPSGNYLYLNAPNNATVGYVITFMDSPTNGAFAATVSNGTNISLTVIRAITQTIDVLGLGGTSNRLFISSGIITNITAL